MPLASFIIREGQILYMNKTIYLNIKIHGVSNKIKRIKIGVWDKYSQKISIDIEVFVQYDNNILEKRFTKNRFFRNKHVKEGGKGL